MAASSSTPTPPPQWPRACNEQYTPVRVVGKGGFGSVWMATRRDASASSSSGSGDTHVAIKIVGNDNYAQREVEILHALSHIQHPNIMRLLQDFPGEDGKDHFIVLSLARGPTLQYILNKEGGLGFVIAQCIAKQLISAISFLHGHAVIHRDISPANLVVSGAMLQDANWWSDEFDSEGKVLALTKKCKVTLIDFGFAIALTPEDLNESAKPERHRGSAGAGKQSDEKHQPRGRGMPRNLNDSCSRQVLRDLSPLGTRMYAAPEVLSGIKDVVQDIDSSCRRRLKRRKSSTNCTTNYGMVADAYSVGSTISHMVTGIPPNQGPDEFFASRNNPLKKFVRKMKSRPRTKMYRHPNELPLDVYEVISELTHYDKSKRCTVRNARNLPWIKGDDVNVGGGSATGEYPCMKTGSSMTYLRCSSTSETHATNSESEKKAQ